MVVAIAALAAGLVYAYKHSETFRKICQDACHAVTTAGRWTWNTILQPVFHYLVDAIGHVMLGWSKLLGALGHVPGFGWAKKAADLMQGAGEKALQLADHINKIPNHKNVTIGIYADTSHAGIVLNKRLRDAGMGGAGKAQMFATGMGRISRPTLAVVGDAPEPENILRDSQLVALLKRAGGEGRGRSVTFNFNGDIRPADWNDFMRNVQQRERTAALGALG